MVMILTNFTTISEFILIGFPELEPRYNRLVSMLLLLVYLAIVTANSFIVIIVVMEKCLQKPPYVIFCKVVMSDIVIATAILPKVIAHYLAEDNVISFTSCFLQMFIVHSLQTFNSLLLMIMALDRYIAVCNPLRYQALIKNSTVMTLCGLSWLISMVQMVTVLVQSLSLPYCDSNAISNCFCNSFGVITLACENVQEVKTAAATGGTILILGPLVFIIFSYTSIMVSVMKITSLEGRYKMFSTCSPQLFIICLYYIPRCFNLLANKLNFTYSGNISIMLLYYFVPPIINPFIYCLRNKEVKEALVRRLKILKGRIAKVIKLK